MNSTHHPDDLIQQLVSSQEFFVRSTRVLEETDSTFTPAEGMMSVAQQVAHAAQTLDWFVEGASRPEGFDLDFETQAARTMAVTSLTAARQWLDSSFAKSIEFFKSKTTEDMAKLLPEGPVMGAKPVGEVVWAMVEHTAHHRGALTVYSRLIGKVPVMPYFG